MGVKKVAYQIYSVIVIVLGCSAYVLANYFPETAKKVGLGWLNSQKHKEAQGAAWDCQLSWDWGTGTAISASHVDYQLVCRAKIPLKIEDFYVYISENTRYTNSSGPGGRFSTQAGSDNLSQAGPIVLKAGQSYVHQGTLHISRAFKRSKNSHTRRQLVAMGRLSFAGGQVKAPESEEPQRLFISTWVY